MIPFDHIQQVPFLGDQATLRTTTSGDVIGSTGPHGEYRWLRIPYAEPPLGDWRWRAPRPVIRKPGLLKAWHSKPEPHSDIARHHETFDHSEDCLYLNIWSPRLPHDHTHGSPIRLPVMVWLHSEDHPACHTSVLNGARLATSQLMIVVTVHYRSGIFGWLRHPVLSRTARSTEEGSGNYGTLDQIEALRWIAKNIQSFNGDPDNITIAGESAAACHVFALLVSAKARGLFHRAIAQSGYPISTPIVAAENYRDDPIPGDCRSAGELLLQLLVNDELAKDRFEAKAHIAAMADTAIAEYLRGKSLLELTTAANQLNRTKRILSTFEDGLVIPSDGVAAALKKDGAHMSVPVLLGCTRDEYTALLFDSPWVVKKTQKAWDLSLTIPDKDRFYIAAEYLSKFLCVHGVHEPAYNLAQWQRELVFAYRFDWAELAPLKWADNMMPGATHGIDIPFVFGGDPSCPHSHTVSIAAESRRSFEKLSAIIMSYWAQFAYDGAPGRGRNGDLPEWLPWDNDPSGFKVMLLNSVTHGGLAMTFNSLTKSDLTEALMSDSRFESATARRQFFEDLLSTDTCVGLRPEDRPWR